MKLKTTFTNLGILAVSAAIGVVVCEFGSRLVLNPADYLGVRMVKEDVLGAAPQPGSPGLDKWCFRNREMPQTADIVAIGDSHTYGNTAKMSESWPKVLEQLSGRTVYNMGMGGYGTNQYDYLLKSKALRLKPQLVICGLYLGDDFENAFTITYGLAHWAFLRKDADRTAAFDIWGANAAPLAGWSKSLRIWLSQHSVLYQLVFHASALGQAQGRAQVERAANRSQTATSLIIPAKHIAETFVPRSMLIRLDQDDPNVREGMRITFSLLQDMNTACLERHVGFAVVLIPTKELVFEDYIEHNLQLNLSEVVDGVLANERLALQRTREFLDGAKIPYVDPLPDLKASVQLGLYVRSSVDMHPGKNGYRVIAESVFEWIKKQGGRN